MKAKILAAAALIAVVTLGGCSAGAENAENATVPPAIGDEISDGSSAPGQSDGIQEGQQPEEFPEEEQPAANSVGYVRVTGDGVNIRSGAGVSYVSLGTAEKKTLYVLLGESGGWYKTFYKNRTAYISAKYCEEVDMDGSGNSAVEAVVDEGVRLMGVKYVYGAVRYHDGTGRLNTGFTVTEFDCSSLTQYIFFKGADKILQVTTRTQIKQGVKVAKADLRRGDLLFFTNDSRKNNTGIERVGHVALYLGDNYILHTSSDYAKIESISEKRWSYFIEARRII